MMHLFGEKQVQDAEILAIQEPQTWDFDDGTGSEMIRVYSQALGGRHHVLMKPTPNSAGEAGRPRVCTYVSKKIDAQTWSIKYHSRDYSTLSLRTAIGVIHVHNVYVIGKEFGEDAAKRAANAAAARKTLRILRQQLEGHRRDLHVVVGDFNLHHPLWSKAQQASSGDEEAEDLICWMADNNLQLLTKRGMPTHESGNTIDLSWASGPLAERCERCQYQQDLIFGGDHYPIAVDFDVRWDPAPAVERRQWKEADWDAWAAALKSLNQQWLTSPTTPLAYLADTTDPADLDAAVDCLIQTFLAAAEHTVPLKKISFYSKPFHSDELEGLRRRVKQARRWARSGNADDIERLRQLRHELGRESKKLATLKHRESTEEAGETKDIRDFWRLAKWARSRGTPRSTHTPTLVVDGRECVTVEDKATAFRQALFPPAPTADLRDIQRFRYPTPLEAPELTSNEVSNAINKTTSFNAPGVDTVPNAVLKQAIRIPEILQTITDLFNACLRIGYCPHHFRRSLTVILKKPGKPDYSTPKAWRPISLLSTLGKALESILATRISYLVEEHNLLPNTHIGGRVGRSCDHALHLWTEKVYQSWRQGDSVVSGLTLDVAGAFDNAVRARIQHNLLKRRIPTTIVDYIVSMLTERSTTLVLQEGAVGGMMPVDTGIPQGSPLSGILYLFYNAELIDHIHKKFPGKALVIGYIDDIAILVWSKRADTNVRRLKEIHGICEHWSKTHASKFAPAKYGLIHMWKNARGIPPPEGPTDIPLTLRVRDGNQPVTTVTIEPSPSLRYLGIQIDQHLTGQAHLDYLRKKASRLVAALRSIAGMTWGITTLHLRRMWTAILLPQISFGCSMWYTNGAYHMKTLERKITNTLQSIQFQALHRIAGAFRTTSRVALEICLYVRPVHLAMRCLAEEACLRIHTSALRSIILNMRQQSTIGSTAGQQLISPLALIEQRLGDLTHIERIDPFVVPPWWQPPRTRIADDKETAIKEHAQVIRAQVGANDAIAYTDGSGSEAGVGAAACTSFGSFAERLGSQHTHTVYAAELHGIFLALKGLVRRIQRATHPLSGPRIFTIFADNQAAIQACARPGRSSGQFILRGIVHQINELSQLGWAVRIHWCPGHMGVNGNEKADQYAKASAADLEDPGLRDTQAACIRTRQRGLALAHWQQEWATGVHGRTAYKIIPAPTKDIFAVHERLRRAASAVLIQMQTGRIALRDYLATIQQWREEQLDLNPLRPPQTCSCEQGRQDVRHVLYYCPRFADLRQQTLGARPNLSLARLLTQPESATKAADLMLRSRLLGQFGALPNTYRVIRPSAADA